MYQTDMYEGLLAETVLVAGFGDALLHAYYARPLGAGPFPGVVLAHHMPGWDSWYKEATRNFAARGYLALCPNLYERSGHGSPEDVAARVRGQGGIPDEQAAGDLAAALHTLKSQAYSNGRVGIFGTCSGGRHAYLAACLHPGFAAVVDCWGGGVVASPADLTMNRPVAPVDYTERLRCPVLGIFGELDRSPTLEQVAVLEQALKQHNKPYEFHMYPDAGHGFFYHHAPAYRQAQAVDGWSKVFAFLEKHLNNEGAA